MDYKMHHIWTLAESMRAENKELRHGQALFNALVHYDPVVADIIRGSGDDPFYDDRRIPAFQIAIFGKSK